MRHSIHILFGQGLVPLEQQMHSYVLKYGEELSPYFRSMRWGKENSENRAESISRFSSLHQQTINLDNRGSHTSLHYCLYFPLYDSHAWDEVKKCIFILNAVERPIEIDLLGFGFDFAKIFAGESDEPDIQQLKKVMSETMRQAIELRKKPGNNMAHFIVMQNSQSQGISLNLSMETLVKIVGEFAMLCVECYDEFFGLTQPNSELQGLGISVLSLDKYYYVDYLLHKAFLYALEREGVRGVDEIERVDVVLATNRAHELLKDKVGLLSRFYDEEVKKRLNNRLSPEEIVQQITPLLKVRTGDLTGDFESFITDGGLTIPAKRAVFSALLGQDDELFDNTMFVEDPLIIDDIDTKALAVYVNANNALLNTEGQVDEAVLSPTGEAAHSPLPEIKKMRTRIIRTTGYIRKLEAEVEELTAQVDNIEEAHKSLIDGEFYVFGEQKFRLLPDVGEVPLQETYQSHAPKAESVDLRGQFTAIKNQGQQGSCTAHAMTAIYEYILKSNKARHADLSEAFLYYNARQRAGAQDEDRGCSYEAALESLVEQGVCEEQFMPYSPEVYTQIPNAEAYSNALTHRVRKAVNVRRNMDDLRSALEDGYPVAISAALYESFGNGALGVISLPAEDERQRAEHGFHSMVICGYSDENRLFVVRNSWGEGFGDGGYCYMPYSYITDESLTRFAAIITEVDLHSARGQTGARRTALEFGDDVRMRQAIKNNALEEERRELAAMQVDYRKLKLQYNRLHESALNPQNQKKLSDSTGVRLSSEVRELSADYQRACDNMDERLNAHDKESRYKVVLAVAIFALIAILSFLFGLIEHPKGDGGWWSEKWVTIFNWVHSKMTLMRYLLVAATIIVTSIVVLLRVKKRKELKADLQEECDQRRERLARKQAELENSKLQMHTAGMVLAANSVAEHSLSRKYQFMQSFVTNLNTWYTVEKGSLNQMNDRVSAPSTSLITNETLDRYFEQQCDSLTENISLCRIFSDKYQLSKEGIEEFRATVEQMFRRELLASIRDFSVYDNFAHPGEYLFAEHKPAKTLLTELANNSDVFVQHSKAPNASKNVFLSIRSEAEKHNWQAISRPYFSTTPAVNSLTSPLKLVMTQMEELTVKDLYL